MHLPFNSIYSHGFFRAAVCIPAVRVADPAFNVEGTLQLARASSEANAALALFPELGLSAYSNEDLFQQDALLEATKAAIDSLLKASHDLHCVLIVGAPLRFDGKLFNCAVVIYAGRILGLVPKTYLPNYREFYEKRQFTSAREAISPEVDFLEKGALRERSDLAANNVEGFRLHVEICEDVWTQSRPARHARLWRGDGAGQSFRQQHYDGKAGIGGTFASQSAECIAAYSTRRRSGESTTDLAWDGHA